MRIFISHSSKDKTRYCNEVVKKLIEKLGKDSIVYDALTFEAGEKSIDEINRTLAFTDLYVILLSQTAVESDWVKSPWYNANDFLLAIRENIKQGKRIDVDYMIPSVYLKSMSDLYADMRYEDVVKLARRALEHTNNTDDKIIYETRYLLCSALAKLKNSDCLTEVQALDYDDKTFLQAFYYRQIGKTNRALDRLNELLSKRPEMSKAKREKVLVLKNLQQFEEATGLARENYYLYSDNPYHIQAYFDCLINTYYKKPENELLYELLVKLGKIQSEKAQSMYGRCEALYLAYVEQDYDAALSQVNQTALDFPRDKKYALVVKFDISFVVFL